MQAGGEQSCFDDNTAVEFFEGSLTERESAEVESHAASCETCRMLLAALARSPSLAGDSGSADTDQVMGPTLPAGGEAHVDLVQGTEVGRFVVLSRIGRGGMGVVFAAYDPRLDRKVALKLLRNVTGEGDSAGQAQQRLMREAQAIAQLSHPNVIQVYDVGTFKSEVYIAMEFVEGETLTSWLRRWDRPWQDILEKFREAGAALADAHASGMAHRDFKPDNVLVGSDERVRVMDFGLARSWFTDSIAPEDPYGLLAELSDEAVSALNNTLTKTGTLLGTPRYMAPEQFVGGGTDARADQFSFCVSLYEALYKRHPFERGLALDMIEKKEKILPRPPPPRTRVPRWIHDVLVRGLSKDPKDRFSSMDSLLRAAQAPRRKQSRLWVAVAAALAVALIGVSGYAMWYQRDDAETISVLRAELDDAAEQAEELLEVLRQSRERSQELDILLDEEREKSTRNEERISELERAVALSENFVKDAEEQLKQRGITPPPKPKPTPIDKPKPARGLGLGAIQSIVDPRMRDIEDCFDEWHNRRQTNETVEVTVTFQISAKGVVQRVRLTGLDDVAVRPCVKGSFTRMKFPDSDGVTEVEYHFESAPGRQLDVASRIVAAFVEPKPARAPLPTAPGLGVGDRFNP